VLTEKNFKRILDSNKLKEIIYFSSNKNYTLIKLDNGLEIKSSYNLGQYEELVKKENFIRIHNTYLVNKSRIKNIDSSAMFLRLLNGEILPINKKYFPIVNEIK
jgi:two-component system, LytTR family, response regulator